MKHGHGIGPARAYLGHLDQGLAGHGLHVGRGTGVLAPELLCHVGIGGCGLFHHGADFAFHQFGFLRGFLAADDADIALAVVVLEVGEAEVLFQNVLGQVDRLGLGSGDVKGLGPPFQHFGTRRAVGIGFVGGVVRDLEHGFAVVASVGAVDHGLKSLRSDLANIRLSIIKKPSLMAHRGKRIETVFGSPNCDGQKSTVSIPSQDTTGILMISRFFIGSRPRGPRGRSGLRPVA